MKIFRIISISLGIFILVIALSLFAYCNYGILEKDVRKGKFLDKAVEKPMEEFLPKIKEAYRLRPFSKLPPNPKIFFETEDKIYWGYAYDDLLKVPVAELYFTHKGKNWEQIHSDIIKLYENTDF